MHIVLFILNGECKHTNHACSAFMLMLKYNFRITCIPHNGVDNYLKMNVDYILGLRYMETTTYQCPKQKGRGALVECLIVL